MAVRFYTETIQRDDETSYDRDLIEVPLPNGDVIARLAVEDDRALYPVEFGAFITGEVVPTYEELLAEWREKHPTPTAEQVAAAVAKHDAGGAIGATGATGPTGATGSTGAAGR